MSYSTFFIIRYLYNLRLIENQFLSIIKIKQFCGKNLHTCHNMTIDMTFKRLIYFL